MIAAPLALVASCNVHELSHAAVGSLLGWEVERVNLCLPAGGSVQYASIGVWAGNAQGYAGGVAAAVFLSAVYVFVFSRPSRPLRRSIWWGAGIGVVMWVGPQLVVGVLEGRSGPGEDYTALIASSPGLYVTLIVFAMAIGVAFYCIRWRALWVATSS